ncbi:SusD/RagB family nutrient-binding outer membrane lipoprotein [Phocaeicola vulgatus]|nr:SusD/RagB family nutrient-binding outer membrane lipoprotein [Phocaeicola vulgatus]
MEVWLKELDQTINYLSSNEIKDVLNNQDFIYKGDLKNGGKLANSLKLKIASPFDKQRPEPCF